MKHKLDFYKNPQYNFTQEMVNDTLKYQKLYGFKIGENNSAVDNEADAFRHTYMQAYLSLNYGGNIVAKILGDLHELEGKLKKHNPKSSNMDLWNNHQGRQIANEIRKEYPYFNKLSEKQQKDIIAGKVVQRMRAGKLITSLDDPRKYQPQKLPFTPTPWIGGVQNGRPLGFATPIDYSQVSQPQPNFSGYTNPLSGSNRIFTSDEVGSMSNDEYSKYEKEIDAQIKAMNGRMPTNNDLQQAIMNGSGVVYVHPYVRQDGTQVSGYYRSLPKTA